MKLLPMDKLGAREITPGVIQFGVFFPWVSVQDSNSIFVKIIHEQDQFIRVIQPLSFPLTHTIDPDYGDYWSCTVNIAQQPAPPGSAWGKPGTYIYRYEVHNPNVGVLDWVVDPFAREFGLGKLSAFTLGYVDHQWSANEQAWKTPALNDLVCYELQLDEFGDGLNGTIDRLDYLADLGVNCLEIMPVSNVSMTVDWGFLPTGYFGVDERFGNRKDFQRLVDAAHQRGLAIILDTVYGHTSKEFAYSDLYGRLRYHDNPFLGAFAKNMFGESTDFKLKLTQDFFYTANHFWLDRFHVDGFRYDCVPNYWEPATLEGYQDLVYSTCQVVKAQIAGGGHWQRFSNGNQINLIQCAEQLEDPVGVLQQSYSNCTWQNGTLDAAKGVAFSDRNSLTRLGQRFGLDGYPTSGTLNTDTLPKSALQYIENHDHERFVCNFGLTRDQEQLFREGDRNLWFKVQPYLIGLLTAKGIPMLWQGQEFGENYWIPNDGLARVMLFRPVRWDYFYDDVGKSTISLVRKLLSLRRNRAEFRSGNYFFYNDWNRYQSRGVLLFSRSHLNQFSLVALNFADTDQTVPFWFPLAGSYAEQLHGANNLSNIPALTEIQLAIPGNYGRIWSHI